MERSINKELWKDIYSLKKLPWLNSEIPSQVLTDFYMLLPEPKYILDYGCGNGRLASFLCRLGAKCLAVDIALPEKHILKSLSNGQYMELNSLNDLEEKFSGILIWGVLHHYEPTSWSLWIEQFFEKLEDNGYLLIGGFSESDIKFKNKKQRISQTTKAYSYPLEEHYFKKFQFTSKEIKLYDGDNETLRTWIYFLGSKNG